MRDHWPTQLVPFQFIAFEIRFIPHACVVAGMVLASPALAQVTSIIKPTLPSLDAGDSDAKDPNAIYCRPPQNQTDSRLPGPKTCRTNRTWDELHAQGLDIGPDGQSVVASEKYRNVHGQ